MLVEHPVYVHFRQKKRFLSINGILSLNCQQRLESKNKEAHILQQLHQKANIMEKHKQDEDL